MFLSTIINHLIVYGPFRFFFLDYDKEYTAGVTGQSKTLVGIGKGASIKIVKFMAQGATVIEIRTGLLWSYSVYA